MKISSLVSMVSLLLSIALLCTACTSPERRMPIPAQQFQFQDQGKALYYRVDKHEMSVELRTLVFVIAGSGCDSMGVILPEYFRGLEGESGALRVFILHKRHIHEHSQKNAPCSTEFVHDDYLSSWQTDQEEFIRHQLQDARQQEWNIKRVLILGISEGAELAPVLAKNISEVTHLAMISNGGMQPLDAFRLLAEKKNGAGLKQEWQHLEQALATPNHSNDELINGRSWRYWNELRNLRHSDNLLSLNLPILLCMGDADQAVPVESAFWLVEQFHLRNKTNLQFHIYPNADHGLRSPQHAYLPDCLHQIDMWLSL